MAVWRLPFRGTLLNTATVLVGSCIGLAAKSALDSQKGLQDVVVFVTGLVVLGLGLKMFLKGENLLLTLVSVTVGGIVGTLIGIEPALAGFAEWIRGMVGGHGRFNEGLITASVLFCVGPMTILGCVQDSLEGHSELLQVKSTLDGVSSIFLAAAMGWGVLLSAGIVLIAQTAVSLAARPFKFVVEHPKVIDEAGAVGGVLLMAIGLGLAGIRKFPAEVLLPSLLIAPAWLFLARRSKGQPPNESQI